MPISDFCDCPEPSPGYYYAQKNASCILACATGLYPQLLGGRADQCIAPAGCVTFGQEVDNILTGGLYLSLYLFNATGPITTNRPQEPLPDPGPGELFSEIYAAMLNLRFAHQYRPGQFIYVRPLTDPLYTTACLSDPVARNVFNGQQMDVVVDVLNTLWMANNNAPRQCNLLYAYATPRYNFCQLVVTFFTPWIVTSDTAGYQSNTTRYILPLLRSFNSWQGNCSVNATCFVASTFNVDDMRVSQLPPPLNFTNPQFFSLTFVTMISQMQSCGDTITCWAGFTCALGELLAVPFVIISSVIEMVNQFIAAAGTQSITWTLGQTIFQMLKAVLIQIWTLLLVTLLRFFSWLDCVICALNRNIPYNPSDTSTWPCSDPLFWTFRPIFILFQSAGIAIIGLVVDTIALVVALFNAISNGNGGVLLDALITWLQDIASVLQIVVTGLASFFFGLICGCTLWNTFGTGVTCNQNCDCFGGCTGRKRSIESVQVSASTAWTARVIYQTFAPDWPNTAAYGEAWAPGDACRQPMVDYAQRVFTMGDAALSATDVDEVAYCLGRFLLFPANTSHYTDGQQFDDCAYVMTQTPSSTRFTSLSVRERAHDLTCIQQRGIIHGMKRVGGGFSDWMPDTLLSFWGNPIATWLPLMMVSQDGMAIYRERLNDVTYSDAVIQSREHEAQLLYKFGDKRVALLHQARQGLVAPVSSYADAVLHPTGASRKRGLQESPPTISRYVARATSFAEMLTAMREALQTNFFSEIVMPALDDTSFSLPPVYDAIMVEDPKSKKALYAETDVTRAYIQDTGENTTLAMDMHTTRDRIMHTIHHLIRVTTALNDTNATHGEDERVPPINPRVYARTTVVRPLSAAASFRRRVTMGGDPGKRPRPGLVRIMARGVHGTFMAMRELYNGAGQAKAKGAKVSTAFDWMPAPSQLTAATTSVASRVWQRGVVPFFQPVMSRYGRLWDQLGKLAAMDSHAHERSRRLSSMAEALRATYRAATAPRSVAVPPELATYARPPMVKIGDDQRRAIAQNTSNSTVPTEYCFNITSIETCQQCFFINNWLGYVAFASRAVVWYYNVSNTTEFLPAMNDISNWTFGANPQVACSTAYAYATWQFINSYTINITEVRLAFFHHGWV